MEYSDAILLIGAAVQRAILDHDLERNCPHARGSHKVSKCADDMLRGLEHYITREDEITPAEIGLEFLRLAEHG